MKRHEGKQAIYSVVRRLHHKIHRKREEEKRRVLDKGEKTDRKGERNVPFLRMSVVIRNERIE